MICACDLSVRTLKGLGFYTLNMNVTNGGELNSNMGKHGLAMDSPYVGLIS